MDQTPAFTVIIPNYNGLGFMEKCMAALNRQSYTSFVVINVDNGSSDGSREYLERLTERTDLNFPVKNIFFDTNTGFSGAVNAGIAAADTEYVVLLNNDTEAAPDYLKELAAVFAADTEKRIFAVSPKMLQLYHPELLDDAGDGYNLLGWAFQRGVGRPADAAKFNRLTHVFSACAGASAYRKSVLEEIAFRNHRGGDELRSADTGSNTNTIGRADKGGRADTVGSADTGRSADTVGSADTGSSADTGRGTDTGNGADSTAAAGREDASAAFRENVAPAYFDPLHFAYLEDLDVSFRARIRGYDIVYAPRAEVLHVGSGTSGSKYNSFKVRLAARNNIYLNYKNMPLLMLLINLPGILAGVVIKQIFFIRRGFGRDYASGFAEGIRTLGACRSHKTPFRLSGLPAYIRTELMLVTDTFSYIQDFLARHI